MPNSKLNAQSITDFPTAEAALRPWLEQQARAHGFRWLLAHSDDGVNWGKFGEDGLIISHDVAGNAEKQYVPELNLTRLIELRLFGPDTEMLLWRTATGMAGRLLDDREVRKDVETRNEKRLLWGVQTDRDLKPGFIVVSEADGLRHVVPLPDTGRKPGSRDKPDYRLYLEMRHYLDFDDEGQAYVAASRLVNLDSHKRKGGENNDGNQNQSA